MVGGKGRGRWAAVATVAVALTLVAACGSSGSEQAGATGAAGAFPVTVDGKLGPATIPAKPLRVVAMSWTDADVALGMGVTPVGMASVSTADGGIEPWTKAVLGTAPAPELFDVTRADPIETVAALKPDVILATKDYNLEQSYADLSRIAPVVGYRNAPNADTWQDTTTRIGTALGVPDAAKRSIDDANAAVAAARGQHPEFADRTFGLLVGPSPDGVYAVNSVDDASAGLLSGLGLTLTPTIAGTPASGIPGRTKLSYEQLTLAQADVLLATGPPSGLARLKATPSFTALPVVARGGYVPLDAATAQSIAFPSPISIRWGIGTIAPKISTALKG
ncbi:ABC transporter substrate-binding protein [Pseudonocardia endophytica]|uniref:Iron complex transport system substrate-binding protein n=1 Tax=Pseudonocardia endophytica TaxID=401976 RepID=A0A4R1HXK9_PSEEN|nr:ABC transporter substrate-binding protein [Pseudonocardia endophytica]TCK26221.1 iron complex transport system substrate-binding protein [Pseudonocardia endophytica]